MAKPAKSLRQPRRAIGSESSGRRKHGVLDVTVVLLDGGYASTAIGPIEVFHSAGVTWPWLRGEAQTPRFRVRAASIDGRAVSTVCSVGLKPECALADIKHTDIIILSASGWNLMDHIARSTVLLPWLRKWHARGAYLAGICTGAAFLAEAGLLDGRQATTHWGVADILRQRYPKVHWRTDQFVTEDDRLLCSGGVYASIDLSLHLVEKFCGHEIALQCAKALLLAMPRSRQSGYSVLPLSRPHSDERIRQAEEYLQGHFDRDVSIDTVAERAGMGPRNFIRRFKKATGQVPGVYIQTLRVAAAKELLEHGAASIQTVCAKVGYADVAFFRSLFKRHTGMTPAEYRSRFAQLHFDRGELARADGANPPAPPRSRVPLSFPPSAAAPSTSRRAARA
jgi:transcriptional regulator GlxA family with amidase domain